MKTQDHHRPLQLDGPHQSTVQLLIGRNMGLLILLAPVLIVNLIPLNSFEGSWRWPLALAGSLGGVALFSPNRLKTLQKMDWAITSVLAGLMAAVPQPQTVEAFFAPTVGFLCGAMVSRPRLAYLSGRPGLIAWVALLPTLAAAALPASVCSGSSPALIYGFFDFPIVCALVAASLCYAAGWTSYRAWHLPWLAFLICWLVPSHLQVETPTGPFSYRLAALTLPACFIAPQMARSRLELLLYEAIVVLFLFHPGPALGRIPDPTLLWSGLIFIPRWYLDRRQRGDPPAAATEGLAEAASPERPSLKCGHGGSAPRLAEWQGLPSCRLAAGHDGGPLLCPYGCLGLGDCQRLCPAGAISLENDFPIIDPGRCRGCGLCRAICPKHLFELHEGQVRAFIPCASRSGLKNNAQYCEKSCLGCGKCRKACPAKAIGRFGDAGAMAVDQAACRAYGEACGQVCREVCPRKIISVAPSRTTGPPVTNPHTGVEE